MAGRSSRIFIFIAGIILCGRPLAIGAVSYLLIQGPFGSGGATATMEWTVNYASGSLTTGQDLLNAVFGTPQSADSYVDASFSTYPYYKAGNATEGAGYIDFGSGSFLLESVTLQGVKVAQNPSYSPGWNYYVAGGAGSGNGGAYASSGSWTYSNDGAPTRLLADGSFDGWVFGSTYPEDVIAGGQFSPTVGNFSNAGSFSSANTLSVGSVPEPERFVTALFGLTLLLLRRRGRPLPV